MKRFILYLLLGLFIIFVGGYFYANHLVKGKVEEFLATQLSPQIDLKYGDLYMNSFTGTISIEGIEVSFENQQDTIIHTQATVDELSLSGFGYWDFFVNDEISFDQIEINKNNLVYFKDRFVSATQNDTIQQDPLATIGKSVLIKKLDIEDTSLTIYNKGQDSVLLRISKAALSVRDIRTDSKAIKKKIPLTYDHVSLVTDSVYMKISKYEDLTINSLKLEDKDIHLEGISLVPKYSKNEFARIIPFERDYTELQVPSIDVQDYEFGFNDSRLFTNVKKLIIDQPTLLINRNKLINDDVSFKPLYSKMLRDLDLQLMVDSILINKSHITYEEKVKADQPPGSIEFTDLDISMAQVGNTQPKGELTTVKANGLFQESRLNVNWTFDVQDASDAFRFSGSLGRLPASNINSFVKPNLNVGFEGTLNEIYFDISGNNTTSITAMKMAYEDFKIDILRKNGKKKNRLLSGIASLFISKDSEKNGDKYREGKGDADRNQTQSVFNFVWISILSAMLKTMT